MGSAASISSTFETANVDKSMFSENSTDADTSYEKNISTLKSILKNDGWKSSLYKYLQYINKECILSWFFDLDEYYRTKTIHKKAKAIEIRARYDPCHQIMPLSKTWIEIWEAVTETLPISNALSMNSSSNLSPSKKNFAPSLSGKGLRRGNSFTSNLDMDVDILLSKHYKAANEYVFVLLVDELPGFLTSSHNQEWLHNSSKDGESNHSKEFDDEFIYEDNLNVLKNEWKEEYSEILIIDDSIMNAQMQAKCMISYGHKVRYTNHGRVGLNIATTRKFSVILVNMSMKTMNPHELAQRIKAWEVNNGYLVQPLNNFNPNNGLNIKSSKCRNAENSSIKGTTGYDMNNAKTAEAAQMIEETYQWLPNILVGFSRNSDVSTSATAAAATVSGGTATRPAGNSTRTRSARTTYASSVTNFDYTIQVLLPTTSVRLTAYECAYQSAPILVHHLYRIIKTKEESGHECTQGQRGQTTGNCPSSSHYNHSQSHSQQPMIEKEKACGPNDAAVSLTVAVVSVEAAEKAIGDSQTEVNQTHGSSIQLYCRTES